MSDSDKSPDLSTHQNRNGQKSFCSFSLKIVAPLPGNARIGLDVEAELVWAVRWRDRLITRWETYMTVEAALGAVALHRPR